MEKITSLIHQLKNRSLPDHLSHLTFKQGEVFSWDHNACAITYNSSTPRASIYLLHEFGHALLGHRLFNVDIDLIKMERQAWDKAKQLAPDYGIDIPEDVVESNLNTYRDWLHSRSLCPTCNATGVQIANKEYSCVSCASSWAVNEARTCLLRRHIIKNAPNERF